LPAIEAMKLLIIDNYDSYTYNIVQLAEHCGIQDYRMVKNDELMGIGGEEFDKVIISPGPGIAVEAGELNEFLGLHYKQKSFLGICLGHEAIAELFGGKLVRMPIPWHGIQGPGIVLRHDYLFQGLPDQFKIGHYHSWIMEKETLPEELEITMVDDEGRIMAIRHREYDLVGLQFHPESVMTDFGREMMGNWLRKEF
jgi:anthranilate synthase component 2